MPDGSFPIRNRSDLRNALRALGRARNPEAARVHIAHRARAMGLTGMLPGTWAVTAAFDPDLHPHLPSGSSRGGEWAPKGGAVRDIRGPKPGDRQGQVESAVQSVWENEKRAALLRAEGNPEHAADYDDAADRARDRALGLGVAERELPPTDLTYNVRDGNFEWEEPHAPTANPQSFVVDHDVDPRLHQGLLKREQRFGTAEDALTYFNSLSRDQKADASLYQSKSPVFQASAMSASVVALPIGLAPLVPPAEWFEDPELDGPTPLTITADGRVYGHLAEWSKCHRGISGRCVFAPRSKNGYASFYAGGQILLDDGEQVPVGRLTVGAHHASLTASPQATAAHYDHSGTVAAFVRAGEDRHGPWLAGATRSDATPEQIRDLRANPPSGDWRNTEGRGLELVAALAVPVPGFPVMAVAASGYDGGEEVTALIMGWGDEGGLAIVASGADGAASVGAAGTAAIRTRVLAARIRGGVSGMAELFR